MVTVQMQLDEALIEEVDRAVEALGTTRADFTRLALRAALARQGEPKGLQLCDLPALLESLPHLSPADADDFAADLAQARAELGLQLPRDPWAF